MTLGNTKNHGNARSTLIAGLDDSKLTGDNSPRHIVDNDTRSDSERLRELRKRVFIDHKFLPVEDEVFCGKLIKKAQSEDATRMDRIKSRQAKDILAKANEKLVFKLANKLYLSMPQGTTREDCVAAGQAGLARAIQGYDPSRGFKLSTYATQWIRHYLQRFSHAIARPGHVPNAKLVAVANVHKDLEQLGEGPVPDDVFNELLRKHNINAVDYHKTMLYNLGSTSIDASISDDEDRSMADVMLSNSIEGSTMGEWSLNDVEDITEKERLYELIHENIDNLPEDQKAVINAMFFDEPVMGRTGEIRKTHSQIQKEIGLRPDIIRNASKQAMNTIRTALMEAGYQVDELTR